MPAGRPSTFSDDIAESICERLAGGESLLSICASDPMPPQSVVFQWLSKQPQFAENYARARQFWADAEFERIMSIADTPQVGIKTETDAKGGVKTIEGDMIEHRRLQVDTRKWALARMSPRKYGDRIQAELTGQGGGPITLNIVPVASPEKKD